MMMKKMKEFNIGQNIQIWLTTSLFSLVLFYFLSLLLNVPLHSRPTFVVSALGLTLLFAILFFHWKKSLLGISILLILLLLQFLTKRDFEMNFISLNFWRNLFKVMERSISWAIFGEIARPKDFLTYLIIFTSLFSVLTNWLLPIPVVNMIALIVPLFYITNLRQKSNWLIFLLLGLFCVYSSYAYKQDDQAKEFRPPISFGILLLVLTFVLQSVLSPELFFNQDLSKKLNAFSPSEGGEIQAFTLQELGYYPKENLRIGGPVKPNTDIYLEIVHKGPAFYLKGSSYDYFDGNTWGLSERQKLQTYGWKGDFFEEFEGPMAETFWYSSKEARDLAYEHELHYSELYVIKTKLANKIVFHGGKPIWFSLLRDDLSLKDRSNADQFAQAIEDKGSAIDLLYSQNAMMVSKKSYHKHGLAIVDYVCPVPKDLEKYEYMMPRRTKVSPEYKEIVEKYDPNLANIIYDENLSLKELLLLMREYIQNNYQYNLSVKDIGKEEEFLEHFLQTREGYCTYFATLYAMLLKDLGYHVRYTEGFVVPESSSIQNLGLNGYRAHAWVEMEMEDIAYYPIEATPSSHVNNLTSSGEIDEQIEQESENSSSEESSEKSSSIEESSKEEPNIPENQEPPKKEHKDQPQKEEDHFYLYLIILLLIFILSMTLYLCIKKYQYYYQRLSKDYFIKNNKEMCQLLWKHIQRQLKELDFDQSPSDTIEDIFNKLSTSIYIKKTSLVRCIQEVQFKKDPNISTEDRDLLHDLYCSLEEELKNKFNRLEYFLKSIIQVKGKPW